jgi:hypothetical protein
LFIRDIGSCNWLWGAWIARGDDCQKREMEISDHVLKSVSIPIALLKVPSCTAIEWDRHSASERLRLAGNAAEVRFLLRVPAPHSRIWDARLSCSPDSSVPLSAEQTNSDNILRSTSCMGLGNARVQWEMRRWIGHPVQIVPDRISSTQALGIPDLPPIIIWPQFQAHLERWRTDIPFSLVCKRLTKNFA